jgi:HTH-type transcriptional regulator / antitoxin MqsA
LVVLVARDGSLAEKGDVAVAYPERCGDCGGVMSVSSDPIPFELRGETLVVHDIEHSTCVKCGEMVLSLQNVGRLQRDAVRQFKEAKGLLTAEEIKAVRLSLGLSQAAFEQLLGTGPKTVIRWEKGAVLQSATADRLMRLIREMPEVVEVLRATNPRERATGARR